MIQQFPRSAECCHGSKATLARSTAEQHGHLLIAQCIDSVNVRMNPLGEIARTWIKTHDFIVVNELSGEFVD